MKIFVYGTLKMNYWNNRLLDTSKYIGDRCVLDYKLTEGSRGGIPFAVSQPGCRVRGEVWDIGDDTETLQALDRLEGHPHGYFRTPVKTEDDEEVFMYVYERAQGLPDTPVNSRGEHFWESR